jgi:hypothetical protein
MARGIVGEMNKMARAAERVARERARLINESERLARLKEQLGKREYYEIRIAETNKSNAQRTARKPTHYSILRPRSRLEHKFRKIFEVSEGK